MRPDDWLDVIGWSMTVTGLVLIGMASVSWLFGCR